MYIQGNILLIPIPFSDLTSSKRRPVLILSNSLYNQKTEDLVVAAVTLEGNLKIPSIIRADKIYTLSKHIVIKKFGSVKPEIVEQVKQKVFELLK